MPKTIKEAIKLFMCGDDDWDLIIETPKKKIAFLHANFGPSIKRMCELETNYKLREACGSKDMKPEEASLILMKAIWDYFHSHTGTH